MAKALDSIAVELRADFGVWEAQMRCVREFLDAKTHIDRVIASAAFAALSELQVLSDQARADLGLVDSETTMTVRVRMVA